MRRLAVAALLFGAGGLGGYVVNDLGNFLSDLNTAGVTEWQAARVNLFEDLSNRACVTAADLRDAASVRGWAVATQDEEFGSNFEIIEGATEVLWVDVTPALPFSKWDKEPFGFDENGCYMNAT